MGENWCSMSNLKPCFYDKLRNHGSSTKETLSDEVSDVNSLLLNVLYHHGFCPQNCFQNSFVFFNVKFC